MLYELGSTQLLDSTSMPQYTVKVICMLVKYKTTKRVIGEIAALSSQENL